MIKAGVKFMYHMMSSSGSSEGLRGLIDGPLPRIIGDILSRSKLFGSYIYSQAANILAIFIHNEPTYLPILQELGLPKILLDSIKTHIPTMNEAIFSIINALSAICLNAAGLAQILEAKPLRILFKVFTQEQYIRCLTESDVCNTIGSSIDELIRHQPALKDDLFEALFEVLDSLSEASDQLVAAKDPKLMKNCRIHSVPDSLVADVVLGESFVVDESQKENQVTFIVSNFVDNLSKVESAAWNSFNVTNRASLLYSFWRVFFCIQITARTLYRKEAC